jgi:hypothetical protein
MAEAFDKSKYKVHDSKTASGRAAVDCDDDVARRLRGKSLDDLKTIAEKNGLAERFKGWMKLNPGQCRMAVGNALRAQARAKDRPAKAKNGKPKVSRSPVVRKKAA